MVELLIFVLIVSGAVGVVCGTVAAIKEGSWGLGLSVFAGAILLGLGCILGLASLLQLIIHLQDPSLRSDSPPAAAEGVGQVLLLFILVPIAFVGSVFGGVVYHSRRNR